MIIRHNDLPLTYFEAAPHQEPGLPMVIVLHGRGADARDLIDLSGFVDPDPKLRFLFANAPRRFEPTPGYSIGWTWFEGWIEEASFVDSREKLMAFVDGAETKYAPPRIVFMGFSQGGVMALDIGLRRGAAGIVVMSGAVYQEGLPDIPQQPPILITHGTLDDMIPIDAARATKKVLEILGLTVEYHEFPMGHYVTPESMEVVREFVAKVLAKERS